MLRGLSRRHRCKIRNFRPRYGSRIFTAILLTRHEGPLSEPFNLDSLIEEFRDEARDQVDRLDAALLRLDREERLDDEARSAVLRTLHTLKGNAGMLGLSPIRDFVHVVENILKGSDRWPPGLVERLFDGAAVLRGAVEAAGGKGQEAAFRELAGARHRLEEVEDGAAPEGAERGRPPDQETPGPVQAEGGDRLRVPFTKLDALLNEVGELLGEADELERAVRAREASRTGGRRRAGDAISLREPAERIRRRAQGLRESVMSLRLVPISRVLGRFHGLVRRLARDQGKEARLVVEGEATEVDKTTADALAEPLLHLVRNAIDHGIRSPEERETAGKPPHGTIRIVAAQEGDRVRVVVEDDGAGLDLEAIRSRAVTAGVVEEGEDLSDDEIVALIFRPGFSTRSDVSTVSGQGVGLDVVRRSIRELRGDLAVERADSGGTRFVMRLPLTVVIVPSLVFEAVGETLALPSAYVARTIRLNRVERVGPTEVVRDNEGGVVPLADPHQLFGWGDRSRGPFGVMLRHGGRRAVLTADRLLDQRDLVVKGLPPYGRRPTGVSGASVLPGGRVILLLDPAEIIGMNRHPQEEASP